MQDGSSERGSPLSQKLERSAKAWIKEGSNMRRTRESEGNDKRIYHEGSKKSILRKKLKRRS